MTAIILNFDDFKSRGAAPGAGSPPVYPPMPFEAGNCEVENCPFMALGSDDDTITFLPGLFAEPRRE